MAINKKLIHFKSKENFEREVANENILDTSICFIQDSKEISTHGTIYKSVNWSILESDPFNGHAYVDLGLPSGTLWATSVIGGDNPLYFAWGSTEGATEEQIESGEFLLGTDESNVGSLVPYMSDVHTPTKYNSEDGKTVLDLDDDAAHVHMGGDWHMPTKEQWEELTSNTTSVWTTQNGAVNGRLFTSTINGNSVFVPAFGCALNSGISFVGSNGFVWSSSVNENNLSSAWNVNPYSSYVRIGSGNRAYGNCILGVINPKS